MQRTARSKRGKRNIPKSDWVGVAVCARTIGLKHISNAIIFIFIFI
jgi:hypothetical protein